MRESGGVVPRTPLAVATDAVLLDAVLATALAGAMAAAVVVVPLLLLLLLLLLTPALAGGVAVKLRISVGSPIFVAGCALSCANCSALRCVGTGT